MNGIEDENLRRLINNLVVELYKYQAESERKRIKERQGQVFHVLEFPQMLSTPQYYLPL